MNYEIRCYDGRKRVYTETHKGLGSMLFSYIFKSEFKEFDRVKLICFKN